MKKRYLYSCTVKSILTWAKAVVIAPRREIIWHFLHVFPGSKICKYSRTSWAYFSCNSRISAKMQNKIHMNSEYMSYIDCNWAKIKYRRRRINISFEIHLSIKLVPLKNYQIVYCIAVCIKWITLKKYICTIVCSEKNDAHIIGQA